MPTQLLYISIIFGATFFYGFANLIMRKTNQNQIIHDMNGIQLKKKVIYSSSFLTLVFKLIAYFILVIPLVYRNCGADTHQYYYVFKHGDKALELGFIWFLQIIKKVCSDPKVGIGIVGAVSIFIVFYAFHLIKQHVSTTLCMVSYCTCLYFYLYNYVRMMLASSILILAYAYILQDKKRISIVCMALAVCFHKSAIIVLVAYVAFFVFHKYKKMIIIVSLAFIGAFVAFPKSFIGSISDERFSNQVDQHQLASASIGLGTIIRALPFIALILLLYKKYIHKEEYFAFLFATLTNLGSSLAGYFVPVTSRLANMFFVYHVLFYIPWLYRNETRNDNKYTFAIFGILYCCFNYFLISQNYEAMGIAEYY